jgi:GNAT superfamily N-acetyltransferase
MPLRRGGALSPDLLHVEPILAVHSVSETVSYWHEVLGFPGHWTWGEPPRHGGVSWGGVFVQFSGDPSPAGAQTVWIRVRQIERLYADHQHKRVPIVSPLEDKPWGFAEYTVAELNGHRLRFAAPVSDRRPRASFPESARLVARAPTPSEYRALLSAVGGTLPEDPAVVQTMLQAVAHAVVAEEVQTGAAVGCALVLSDSASFYYVKDVMVHPAWQGQRVGTAMMRAVTDWIEANAPKQALAALIAGEHLASFYRQFGFSSAFAMIKPIGDTRGR